MNPGIQVTLSCMLTFGVPLAFAVRERLILPRGGWRPPSNPAREPPPPPPPGEPSRPPLPACLIPNLTPLRQSTREKELEPA